MLNEKEYFEFLESHNAKGEIEIITDREAISRWERDNPDKPIGIVPNNPYFNCVFDLVRSRDTVFRYARVVYPQSMGTVALVRIKKKGKDYFLLRRQWRHAVQGYAVEVPRGFKKVDKTTMESLLSNVFEETNLTVEEKDVIFLGSAVTDSGLASAEAGYYLVNAQADDSPLIFHNIKGNDSINSIYSFVTEESMTEKIMKGEIKDNFTITAFMLYKNRNSSLKNVGE